MRIVGGAGDGYPRLEIPRHVLEDLLKGGSTRTADLLPVPAASGNSIVQIAGGLLLSLGALFLGERFFRRRRNSKDQNLKLVPIALLLGGSLLLLSPRGTAQSRDDFNAGNLSQATQAQLEGTVAVRIADGDQKAIVLLVGGERYGSRPRPPLPPRK
jgi:hypothetical protein